MTGTVLLYGGTSYVGEFLLQPLLDAGFRIVAVVNNPVSSQILLGRHLGKIELTTQAEAVSAKDVRAVINLAYVREASPHRANRANERLVNRVHEAAVRTRSDRVIHASTVAVFGYEFTEPPSPVAVPVRPGNFYIETKTRAEHMLAQLAKDQGYHLSIVRFGNVVGPGSAAWTARLAQRLLEAKPLLKQSGVSNATYVENIGSYLAHLSAVPKEELDRFGTYHHLTEFAHHSWDEFLNAAEQTIGMRRVGVDLVRGPAGAPLSHTLGTALKQAYRGRLGGYARGVLGRLPWPDTLDAALNRVKQLDAPQSHLHGPRLSSDDLSLLGLLAARVVIEPHVLSGWTAPVPFPVALERISAWLSASGYAVRSAV